jgi:aryl-alcohol dehydrogenase-like predicted oxidoreductase
MSLVLGTVQFGADYGVTNTSGQCSPEEVIAILDQAIDLGVKLLDTAPEYGNAERVLGQYLPTRPELDVITKIGRLDPSVSRDAGKIREFVRRGFSRSLDHLKRTSVYGLLVHHVDDFLEESGAEIYAELEQLKKDGRVRKIGASVYDGEQIDRLLESYSIDLVQLPLNVFDQRLVRSGHLEKLKAAGVEVHARSVFLQGVLAETGDHVPELLQRHKSHILDYRRAIAACGMMPVPAALGFISTVSQVDSPVVGVTSSAELTEISGAWSNPVTIDFAYSRFDAQSPELVDPRQWSSPQFQNDSQT